MSVIVVDRWFIARASANRDSELIRRVYGPVAAEIVGAFFRAFAA